MIVLFFAATTLTSWHLMVTYCSLHVALRLNFFENKPIDTKTVMLFGILNGISIGLLNLSLGFNSIGFYQVHISLHLISIKKSIKWTFFFFFFFSCYLFFYFFLFSVSDDETCNHTIHCPVRDSVPQKTIQVSKFGHEILCINYDK